MALTRITDKQVTFKQGASGSVVRNLGDKLRESVSVLDFGAVGDGVTDDTSAIQAAIDSVCLIDGTSAGSVYFPTGRYKVTSQLNITNNRFAGTRRRDGLKLHGDGFGSVIVGETGAGYAIADVTGTQFLRLQGLQFASGSTNKSTIGIYQGLSTDLPQTQNQLWDQVYIIMHDDASANSGRGTIGLWNFGAEENTYHSCYFNANRAAIYTTQANWGIAYGHPILPQATSHSLGMTTLSGECFIVSLNRRFAPLTLQGVNSFHCENTYISNIGTGGSNDSAVDFYSTCSGVTYNGTIEQLGTLHVLDTITASKFQCVFGDIANSSAPVVLLERGGGGIITNSDFRLSNNAVSSQTRELLLSNPLNASEQISTYIQNSSFYSNLPSGYTGLTENLLWNPNTRNVSISGPGYSYDIGANKHSLSFSHFDLGPSSNAMTVCKIKMPTALSSVSAGGIGVKMEGILSTNGHYDGGKSTVFISSTGCISTSENGVVTSGAATTTLTGKANVNSPGNDITAAAVNLSAGAGVVSVVITPTVTGSNGEHARFTGNVSMFWDGWNSVAPSMVLNANVNP